MRSRKPDLLFVLSLFLFMGIVMTSYGSQLLNNFEAEARQRTFAHSQH